MKTILNFFALLFGCKFAEYVDEGLVDYSGQGRNKYGK